MPRHPLTWLVLVSVCMALVSGCVSNNEKPKVAGASSDGTVAGPATVSDDTGAIQGTVTDDSELPIEGADVAIGGTSLVTKTDAGGRFTLSGVTPGEATVQYQKLGFDSAAKRVTVIAGEVAQASMQLSPIPILTAYPEVIPQDGYVACSVRAYPGVPLTGVEPTDWYSSVNVCGLICIAACLPVFSADKFQLTFKLKDTHTQEVALEMTWRSTQATGGAMSVQLEDPPHFNQKDGTYVLVRGLSPLRGVANESWMQHVANYTKVDCTETKCTMNTRVFADAKLTGLEMPVPPPDVPLFGPPPRQIDVGVILDQKFTQYLSAFHYMDVPEGYTALADR